MLTVLATSAQAQVSYSIDFSTSHEGWTAIDANADGKTWTAGSNWQDQAETNRGDCVYTEFSGTKTFDDYYVSPAVELEAGKSYKVKVVGRTNVDGYTLALALGTDAADASTFTEAVNWVPGTGLTRSGWTFNWDGTTSQDYVIAVTKGGTFNVGIHATSTAATNYSYSSVALFSYSIEETTEEATITVNTGAEDGGDEATKVLDVPYSTDFGTEAGTADWTILDANDSGNTWSWSQYAFMDYVDYTSYTGVGFSADFNWDYDNPQGDADDYYISPALNLKKGVTYTVTTNAAKYQRCTSTTLKLALGTDKADASTFTDLNDIKTYDEYTVVDRNDADTQTVTVEQDGIYYLAVHIASTGNTGRDAYGAIFSFAIDGAEAPVETAAPGDVTDAVMADYGGYIDLEWNNPTRDAEGNELPADAQLKVYVYENGELAANCEPNPVTGKPGAYCSTGFETDAQGATYKLVVEYNGKTSEGIELFNAPTVADLVPTAVTPDTTAVQEYLTNIAVTFDQEVFANEMATGIVTFTKEGSDEVEQGYVYASGNTLTIYYGGLDEIVAPEDGTIEKWTVTIPEGMVVDATAAEQNFTGGHSNAALELHYNVGKLAETLAPTSVVPATTEVQEYLSTITVNFDEEVFAGPEGITDGTITLTNAAEGKEINAMAYVTENSLVIYPSESIDAAEDGTYSYWTVNIPAGIVFDAAATEVGYQAGRTNAALTYDYTVGKEVVTPEIVVADPADGSTVASLSTITLTFTQQQYAGTGMTEEQATIKNAEGEIVSSFGIERTEFGTDFNQMVVKLKEALSQDGTYTIEFPAGFFSFGESGNVNSKAFTLTYTIDTSLGINGVSADRFEGQNIYTIGGQKVQKVNQKGLYIVNGKKVVVK